MYIIFCIYVTCLFPGFGEERRLFWASLLMPIKNMTIRMVGRQVARKNETQKKKQKGRKQQKGEWKEEGKSAPRLDEDSESVTFSLSQTLAPHLNTM